MAYVLSLLGREALLHFALNTRPSSPLSWITPSCTTVSRYETGDILTEMLSPASLHTLFNTYNDVVINGSGVEHSCLQQLSLQFFPNFDCITHICFSLKYCCVLSQKRE